MEDLKIHPCGSSWNYCSGKCSVCPTALSTTPAKLFDKIFGDEEFTPGEIHKIVGLLGLTKEETNTIFYS